MARSMSSPAGIPFRRVIGPAVDDIWASCSALGRSDLRFPMPQLSRLPHSYLFGQEYEGVTRSTNSPTANTHW